MQSGSPDDSRYLVFPTDAQQGVAFRAGSLAARAAIDNVRRGTPVAAMPTRPPNPYDGDTILGAAWLRGWDDWITDGTSESATRAMQF